jgi:hypothetical protein
MGARMAKTDDKPKRQPTPREDVKIIVNRDGSVTLVTRNTT